MQPHIARLIELELKDARPAPDAADLIKAILEASVSDDGLVIDPKTGHPRVTSTGANMSVAQLLAELGATKPRLFQPASAADSAGVGETALSLSESDGTPNPWTAAAWNLTKQMVLEKTNPDLAARLQAAAAN
jgi:hypothetical protein